MRWLHRLLGRDGDASVSATLEELRDERLSAYLDGELVAAEAAALERELGEDTALRTELELLRDVRSALRTLGEVRAPRSFALAAPPAPAPRRLIGIELLTPLATAAAGLLLVFVLVAPGGERATSGFDETASLAAAPEAGTTLKSPAPATAPDASGGGATLAAPAESPTAAAGGAAAAAAAPDNGGTAREAADGTAEESAANAQAEPPTALAAQADAGPVAAAPERSGAKDDSRSQAIGLAALTAVLAALSLRQWRQRRREAGSR